jgi:hypothetical protein
VHGVGEVDDLHADRCEVLLQPAPAWRPAPVVALEDPVEADLLPGVQLVGHRLLVDGVDEVDVPDDLEPLRDRDERRGALGERAHLVRDHAGDQEVALAPGVLEDVQVADVEQVVHTGRVADYALQNGSPRG